VHPEQLIVQLMASLRQFGFVGPILVDANFEVVDSEALFEAARRLKLRSVPTLRLDHLDENQIRVLRLTLKNLATKAQWDSEQFALEVQELVELDLDMSLEVIGLSSIEFDALLTPAPTTEAAEDSPPVAVQPDAAVSRLGDFWFLGKHKLLCASSLERTSFATLMDGEFARVVIADLPYNVKIDGHVSGLGKHAHREFVQASGELSAEEFEAFQAKSVALHSEFSCGGSLQYYFMDWRSGGGMYNAVEKAGLSLHNVIVWVKSNAGMGSLYRSQHELVFLAKKGLEPHRNNVELGKHGRHRTNCWQYPGMNSFGADRDELLAMHSTVKNLQMICDAIRDVSHRGEVVLDGFGGSGTTLIAAEKTGRVCRMIELDPLYVDCIIRRWGKLTGGTAHLGEPDGPMFEDVRKSRVDEQHEQSLIVFLVH
jgi:DNA modification methylase